MSYYTFTLTALGTCIALIALCVLAIIACAAFESFVRYWEKRAIRKRKAMMRVKTRPSAFEVGRSCYSDKSGVTKL